MEANDQVDSREEILSRIQQVRDDIRNLGVRRLSLFGSFHHGDPTPNSDVDVLVEFEEGEKNFDRFMELSYLLEEVLGREVELVTRESLSPYIGPRILEDLEDVEI